MIRSKSFFLLVLFSLFSLNARDDEHKKCERKRSLIEMGIKLAVAGFVAAHANAFFLPFYGCRTDVWNSLKTQNFRTEEMKACCSSSMMRLSNFVENSKDAPFFIGLIGLSSGVAALAGKPIF